jgi:hypothetical protein
MFRLGAIAGFSFFVSAAALASPVITTSASPGEAVAAGSVLEVRWAGLSRDAEEVELLLYLDGGASSLRLTEELSPDGGSYRWRVPELSARRAFLVLRMGVGGREIESEPTAEFEIVPSGSSSGAAIQWSDGEMWLAPEACASEERPRPAAGLGATENRWSARGDITVAIDAPQLGVVVPARVTERSFMPGHSAARAAPSPQEARVIPFLALRI